MHFCELVRKYSDAQLENFIFVMITVVLLHRMCMLTRASDSAGRDNYQRQIFKSKTQRTYCDILFIRKTIG